MHPDWARSLRDQCIAADVPFFFKQWGQWLPCSQATADDQFKFIGGLAVKPQPGKCHTFDGLTHQVKIGKKKAGRLLDEREWNDMPEVAVCQS
jgi:protein gp37